MSKNQDKHKESDESFLYTGRIREIEQEIVRFQLDLSKSNSQSETLQKIISALLLHEKLTQSQIKKLTNLSKSTISTGLTNLTNLGHVRKVRILGSKEYQYFVTSSYIESMNNALGNLENELIFLKLKLTELTKKYSSDKEGFLLLSSRLKELVRVFALYQRFLEKLVNDEIELDKRKFEAKLTKEDIQRIDEEFDPEIKIIEDEIIDFFQYNSAYSTMDELFLEVYVYFFARNILTQEKLRELTGLSLGKISQIVNSMLEMKVIEKIDKVKMHNIIPENKTRQQIYSMNSIQKSFFGTAIVSGKNILKSYGKFRSFFEELRFAGSTLKKQNGYKNVLKVLENSLELMEIIDRVEKIYQDLI